MENSVYICGDEAVELKNGDPCEVLDNNGVWTNEDVRMYIGKNSFGKDVVELNNGTPVVCTYSARPIRAKQTRPMTRCEMIAWAARVTMELATNPGADVWMVDWSAKGAPTTELGVGSPPMSINYTDANWWRSRLDKATGKPVKWERMEVEVE